MQVEKKREETGEKGVSLLFPTCLCASFSFVLSPLSACPEQAMPKVPNKYAQNVLAVRPLIIMDLYSFVCNALSYFSSSQCFHPILPVHVSQLVL